MPDNVIPFPGGPFPDGRIPGAPDQRPEQQPDPDQQAAIDELAKRFVAEQLGRGASPHDLLAQIMEMFPASQPPSLSRFATPTLLPVPTRPVAYRIRLDLDGAKPPVWRRLVLAGDLTLDEVHEVVQLAMGWFGGHLHHFKAGPKVKDYFVEPFRTDYDREEGETDGLHEGDVRLDQVLGDVGDRLFYTYDFGDNWEHTLKLEAVEEYDEARPARCLGGRRADPLEDMGGVHTLNEVVAWLAAPDSDAPADEGLLESVEWLPPGYDPTDFDAEALDAELVAEVRR